MRDEFDDRTAVVSPGVIVCSMVHRGPYSYLYWCVPIRIFCCIDFTIVIL